LNAAKEKLEIVSGAAPPPFRHTTTAPLSVLAGCRIFAWGLPRRRRRRNAEGAEERSTFGLIQEYCTIEKTGTKLAFLLFFCIID